MIIVTTSFPSWTLGVVLTLPLQVLIRMMGCTWGLPIKGLGASLTAMLSVCVCLVDSGWFFMRIRFYMFVQAAADCFPVCILLVL